MIRKKVIVGGQESMKVLQTKLCDDIRKNISELLMILLEE